EKLNEQSPLKLSSFDDIDINYYPADGAGAISPRKRMESIIGFCKKYAEDFSLSSQSLLFMGATGLGKTHLSLAIADVVTKKGFGVVYGSAQGFLNQLEQEHFGKNNAQGDEYRTMLLDCDLLILDDLGSEFSTSFTVSSIYDIINTRILSGKPTIISTNLTLAEIEDRYSERILSRLCGCYKVFKFDGSDIRTMRI
ncbi:MAG: ATP-binding protein, partial [Clostridia bacterium]|nr:ATP-binding protein [Clostridia bacterium]